MTLHSTIFKLKVWYKKEVKKYSILEKTLYNATFSICRPPRIFTVLEVDRKLTIFHFLIIS